MSFTNVICKKGEFDMWTDNASQIDMLFYKPYADIVAQVAVETDDNPLTVGVFGLWGAGKSTLLNLINPKYVGTDGVICVSINAWMFESYEDAKAAIMEALLRELEESESVPAELKKNFKNLIKKIDFLKVGTKAISTAAPVIASLIAGNPLPLIVNLPNGIAEIGSTIKNVSDSIQGLKEEYLKDENSAEDSVVNNVRKFRKEFEESLKDEKIKRVVVLIDDLDRCQPERIIETLEVIKLFLSVKKTTFIIAADENVIQYAIKKKYPNLDGFNVELDKEYIEKIIQLPIQIPELSVKDIQNYMLLMVMQKYMYVDKFQDMITKIEQGKLMIETTPISLVQLEEITGSINDCICFDKRQEYKEIVDVIMQIRQIAAYTLKGNPRQTKRFLNTFITKRQLSKLYYGDELDMGIMAKLLILHKLSPELFNQLSKWNANFNLESDAGNEQYKLMRQGLDAEATDSEYYKWYKPRIKTWVKCPPEELEKENLDKYFYLTREILNQPEEYESNLSEASKKILERLGSVSQGLALGLVDDMVMLPNHDLDDVMLIVLKRIEKGNIESYLYRLMFEQLETYRRDIVDAIRKSDKMIEPSDFSAFKAMYEQDADLISDLLSELVRSGKAKQKVVDVIVKKGD